MPSEDQLLAASQRWTAACAALNLAADQPTIEWMAAFAEFRASGDEYADALRRVGFPGGVST